MLTKENFNESHIRMLQKQEQKRSCAFRKGGICVWLIRGNQAGRNAVYF